MVRARFVAAALFVCVAIACAPRPLSAYGDPHARLIASANAERVRTGLAPLAEDAQLDRFAVAFAQRMAQQHFFDHTSPDGTTFEDRLRAAHVRFRFAAENIGEDQDAQRAHQAFVESPAHRANIVAPGAHRMGSAALAIAPDTMIFVEEFSD